MKFNPLHYPIIFSNPLRLATSSWIQHLPFAMLLVDIVRPKILVELGTHYGVSYCGFCQAVKELHTGTLCYAVDTWQGDEHTGAYGTEVYENIKHHHDPRYGNFSSLLKLKFDEAASYFADSSIDLLHIDGYHTYEAVKHDFETWQPKLSQRAVVLLHDINERERQFGVWRYWDELKAQYPSFEMRHEHGLGMLYVGDDIPEPLNDLLRLSEAERTQVCELFFILGSRITAQIQSAEFADRYQHVLNLQAALAARDAEINAAKRYITSLTGVQPPEALEHLASRDASPGTASPRSSTLAAAVKPTSPQAAQSPLPLSIPAGSTVICTIISKNYLAAARTLMRSVHEFHPHVHLVTLLVDEIEGCFDPQAEVFATYLAADLDIPHWRHFSMKYDIMELNTAVKPFLLYLLLDRYQAQKVIYFDPDIVVYHDLDQLLELLDQHMAVLTPHILTPIRDTLQPAEVNFLQVGTYNLGFFAISRQGQWRDLLSWWKDKLYAQCTREIEHGLFVDQHWMDLVPALFDNVMIMRDPGYNVAYWNIQGRDLRRDAEGNYQVDGQPLIFFHFSGFSVESPQSVSRHQNRFVLDQLNDAYQACFQDYRARLLDNSYQESHQWRYAYGYFADGIPVPDVLRLCLRRYDLLAETWDNPFDTGADSFRAWAVHPQALPQLKYLSPYALTYYVMHVDYHQAFPDPLRADERRYAKWFAAQAGTSDGFDEFFVAPIRAALNHSTPSLRPVAHVFPQKTLRERIRQAVEYYQTYPTLVKPHLPPEAFTTPPIIYTGPTNLYGQLRSLFQQFGILQTARRVIGLRIILTARSFFGDSAAIPSGLNLYRETYPVEFPRLANAPDGAKPSTPAPATLLDGVNVIGYLRAETGVAEAARRTLSSLQAVQYPVSAYAIDLPDTASKQDNSMDEFSRGLLRPINIFHVNADMTHATQTLLGTPAYRGHYNIGYWFWELSRFPARWQSAADVYDEIWVGSRFVQQAIAETVRCPVIHMPGSIDVKVPNNITRSTLGLPDDVFIFLFIFDASSVIERKNPWAIVRAYEQAFSSAERASKVKLVMKISHLERFPAEQSKLYAAMEQVSGLILDRYMSRVEVNALINSCDVYVSLHRSEGFGLTLAEAMYLGKLCIATDYSGNTDFMTRENSYLVPYQLVELTTSYPPYESGNHWAEPDMDVAVQYLRAAFFQPEASREKGLRAKQDIRANYAPVIAGRRISARLNAIIERTPYTV